MGSILIWGQSPAKHLDASRPGNSEIPGRQRPRNAKRPLKKQGLFLTRESS